MKDKSLNGLFSEEAQVDEDLPVGVLCIMGPSRSGKSFFLYFLNLYLEQLRSETSIRFVNHRERSCGYDIN